MTNQDWLGAFNYAIQEKLREEVNDEIAEIYSEISNEYIKENPPPDSESDN